MISNKFIRILIVINGLIFLFLMSSVLYKEFISPLFKSSESVNQGIIVGEGLEEATDNSLQLQSIEYDKPYTIRNSNNLYLPISIRTYEKPKKILNNGPKVAIESLYSGGRGYLQTINIVFIDENLNVINTLLDKKGLISDIEIKPMSENLENIDTAYHHLCYLISYEDTNQDGKLNSDDNHDLYISDLDGSNLTQISHNVDIASYELDTKKAIIDIRYKERTDEREEYKKIKFAKYDLNTSTWMDYEELNNHLLELEKLLLTKPTN